MRDTCMSDQEMREANLEEVKQRAYTGIIGHAMSRAERRTAHGRMLIAQAEAAALKAEVEYLKSELAAMEQLL